MVTAPPVRRRLVGRALRRYREQLGYTLEDVGRHLECHPSKLSRIETGERGIRPKELRELLSDHYRVPWEQQTLLMELADPRGAFGWYRDYADVLPGAQQDYAIMEAAASKISVYEAQRVPALLQTPAYARALAQADPSLADDPACDRAVEALLARQQAMLGERRPEVHLVIGQATLHQQVGSPAVMNEQLRMLAWEAADSGRVTVQVLPFESGAHMAAGEGTVEIVQFTGAPGQGLVHVGGIAGGTCLEGQADLTAYAGAFDQLQAFANSPAQSALLLRGLSGD
jgi:transcriptional regulator with XRE-family HTH domain